MYWIMDLKDEVHLIWVVWTSNLEECKGDFVFQSHAEHAEVFGWDMKILDLFGGGCQEVPDRGPRPLSTSL